ncbi:hypothetical protein LIER_05182 [Lithospermum erythrorhizon]|uniref:Reverse transcriptase Ty1/copia-type domain-containing protein n=1 Tax=Lithospermum erythrorhizon TaxID=34254 RepID=A0AAV3P3M3_LITER
MNVMVLDQGLETCEEDAQVGAPAINNSPDSTSRVTIDEPETFAPVARLEAIRLLLSLAFLMKFKLHQMNVKSDFLNGVIEEEVYVEHPKGFVDNNCP